MKKILLISTLLASGVLTAPAYAEVSNDAMMKQLKEMQSRMEQMQREMNQMRSELAKTKAQAKTAEKATQDIKAGKFKVASDNKPSGDDVKISMVPAPRFETADGAYSFKLGGRAQFDAGVFNDDRKDHPDGTQIRRARLGVSGTIARDWNYKLENDFGVGTSLITDAYLEYTGFKPIVLKVGQFKEPFGLETLTSSLHTTFVERASNTLFSPDRHLGAQVSTYGEAPFIGAWTAAAGGFGDNASVNSTSDESKDATARVTIAPLATATEVVHLGVAGSYRVPDSATDTMTFASRPESRLATAQQVSTGAIAGVDSTSLLGLEAATVWGPFSLQSEYAVAEVERTGALASQTFDGYYVEGSYFLTGESRAYNAKSGVFDRVKPKQNFSLSEGGWGAWQVAARYSDLNLNDSVIAGGQMKNATLGLRWIPHPHLSFMLNYIKVNTDNTAVVADDDPDVWMLRAQFDF